MGVFRWAVALLFLIIVQSVASGQLYINEFMASNGITIEDPDFNDNSDWFEIYNAGSTDVNLKGYFLTDDLTKPDKWQVTSNLIVQAGGYLIIWADDMDTGNHTSFKLSQDGEEIGIFNANLDEIDGIQYGFQKGDVSYGRNPQNLQQWLYFDQPTPGAANGTSGYSDFTKQIPHFDIKGKIFDAPFDVKLSAYSDAEIRFTLDGSEPSLVSQLYEGPIPVNQTTIVRARLFEPGNLPGPVVTHSYFLDDNYATRNLPIVSIVGNPDNFWDPVKGIYVQNFKPEWEVPINIELFENDGSDRAGFNEAAGAKVNGLNSWELPQKMLGIYFRGRYGSGNLSYPLFFDRERKSFDSFALRASGSDWSYTLFRDILGQGIIGSESDVDFQGERPSIVYINGEYMGIHNIRSKVDADFIKGNYGMESGTFDMVENQNYAEEGSLTEYEKFQTAFSKDLSVQSNFDAVAEIMDIEQFTDYIITELYVRNTSIIHNVMAWKPHGLGKWRWILMDLDRGFFTPESNLVNYFEGQTVLPFGRLMKNAGYRTYFKNRLTDRLATTFNPDRVKKLIDFYAARIKEEMPYHVNRWKGTTSNYGDAIPSVAFWEEEVASLKAFAEERPMVLLDDLTNYGSTGTIDYVIDSDASKGMVYLNDQQLSEPTGHTLKNENVVLKAEANPGNTFSGWETLTRTSIISTGSDWKYLDDGTNQGTAWYQPTFNDVSWSNGQAQFGYGDGDETTVVGYAGASNAKSITTYFRKNFTLTAEDLTSGALVAQVLYDDGVIVYVNGQEVARGNMPAGSINYQTRALLALGGSSEDQFKPFVIDASYFQEGVNMIAVELHQGAPNSSDISFDLELVSFVPAGSINTLNPLTIQTNDSFGYRALFEATGECILSGDITQDIILSADCSPYYLVSDLTVTSNATLAIEPGVTILGSAGASIFIKGKLDALGTEANPIHFEPNTSGGNDRWGALLFDHAAQKSSLEHIEIIGATGGPNRVTQTAAISSFHSEVSIDHAIIEDVWMNPIIGRYSNITLTNSQLHSKVTGDLINVKYGQAFIANSNFKGNDMVDTDAIDLDDVTDGVIRNCRIQNFFGSNSDGVDIGEEAQNILIDSLVVYNVSDKGISVGQQSSAKVTNSLFLNCNMGMGLKDSCQVVMDKCTFYGNNISVALYEKNIGHEGGNAVITNSILSNSNEMTTLVDDHSTLRADYSLSDGAPITNGANNLFSNPQFVNPTWFDFRLKETSPAKGSGLENQQNVDLGIYYDGLVWQPNLLISEIFVNGGNFDLPEYLALYNPGDETLDISGYAITKGVTFDFPTGSSIPANSTIYVTDLAEHSYWAGQTNPVYEWVEGKLSNNGEALQIEDAHGIVIDHLVYDELTWPVAGSNENYTWRLLDEGLDNHLVSSWSAVEGPYVILGNNLHSGLKVYPNPVSNVLVIEAQTTMASVSLYSLNGTLLPIDYSSRNGKMTLDLSGFDAGLYLLKVGDEIIRVLKR